MPKRPLQLPQEAVASFCRRHHIRKLSLFGSALDGAFTSDSDIDLLVEFEEEHVPGLAFFAMQQELSDLLGRKVDLHTPAFLSPYFRDEVMAQAEVKYVSPQV